MEKLKTITKIILIILVLTSMLFILAGCTSQSNAESERQFEYVSTEFDFKVIYHKKTKIMYAVSSGYYTYGNLTVLVDAEGKPLLYEGE